MPPISDRVLRAAALMAVAAMALFLCCRVGVLPAASAGDDVWYDDSAWWLLHEGVLRRHIHDNALGDAVRDFLPPVTALFTAGSFRLFGPTQFAVGIVPTASAAAGMAMLATALRLRSRLGWALAAGLATVPFYAPDLIKVAGHNRFEAEVFLFIAAGLLLGSMRPTSRAGQWAALAAAGLSAGGAIAAHYPVAPFSWGLVALWACWRPKPLPALVAFGAGTVVAALLGLAWIGADLPLFWRQMTASGARYDHSLARLPRETALYGMVSLACLAAVRQNRRARLFATVALLALPAMLWWATTAFYAAVATTLALAIVLAEPKPKAGARALTLALLGSVSLVAVSASATALRDRRARDGAAFTRHLRAVLPAGEGGLVLIDRAAHLALLPCYHAGQLHHMVAGDAATLPSRVLLDPRMVGRVEAVVLDEAAAADHQRALPLYRAFTARHPRAVPVSAAGIGIKGEPPYAMTVLLPATDHGPRLAARCG